MKTLNITALILLFYSAQAFAEFRIWEDTKGNIWEGEFITMNAGNVVIRNQAGKKTEYNPQLLSEADQSYLESVVPPRLSVDVSKITNHTAVGSKSEKVHCVVSIKQADTRNYTGELTAVLVLMAEDIRTGLKTKVGSSEKTFTLPAKRGEKIQFAGSAETFIQKGKSGRAYSGYILVVWDRFGNAISIESNRDSFSGKATLYARPKKIKINRTSAR